MEFKKGKISKVTFCPGSGRQAGNHSVKTDRSSIILPSSNTIVAINEIVFALAG